MPEKNQLTLRIFKKNMPRNRRSMRRFLSGIEKEAPRGLDKLTQALAPAVWQEVECLSCANCCKTMTPTFTKSDIKRISAFLGDTPDEFKAKWLYKERKKDGDWLNRKQPCQFLNLQDNKCSIYEVRPADCAGFPHFPKKMKDYMHVHKQNLEYCPATYRMVEKLMHANY